VRKLNVTGDSQITQVAMAVHKATAVIAVIFGSLLTGSAVATNEEQGVTDLSEYADRKNVTEESAGCPPSTHHVSLRYIVVTFNFSRVQTPFIVAAWILFVTLAKIGNQACSHIYLLTYD